MGEQVTAGVQLLGEDAKDYLKENPELLDRVQRIERVYRIFGDYLNLTQSRVVVRESFASNTEAELSATLSRVDR